MSLELGVRSWVGDLNLGQCSLSVFAFLGGKRGSDLMVSCVLNLFAITTPIVAILSISLNATVKG
jgi:hypothetical protein